MTAHTSASDALSIAADTLACADGADSVRQFIADAARYPLLSATEEARLTRLCKGEDEAAFDARQALMNHNLRLVVHVAKWYRGKQGALELGDLIGFGCLGLARGIEHFDPERGFKFSTYATWWIRQAISRGLTDTGNAVRLPVYLRGERREAARINVLSLDAPTGHDDGGGDEERMRLRDVLADPHDALDAYEGRADRVQALAALVRRAKLTAREREVIARRFGFGGDGTAGGDGVRWTLSECGKEMQVSRERVRQLEGSALRKLRLAAARLGLAAEGISA